MVSGLKKLALPALFARLTLLLGLVLLAPSLVAVIYEEWMVLEELLSVALPLMIVGGFFSAKLPIPDEINPAQALFFSAMGWLLITGIGSLPYLHDMAPLDAFFEAMSGFTATGMTLLSNLEDVPHSLLFWRALTQWLGGLGIVLFFILFMTPRGIGVWRLYVAEAREEKLTIRAWDTVKDLWLIYTLYTFLCAILLTYLGLSGFDALCHSFTTLATGGFSTKTLNIEGFHNPWVESVLVVFMIIGATNFHVHLYLLKGRNDEVWRNLELKVMLMIIAVASIIVSLDIVLHLNVSTLHAFRLGVFQTVSIATTTGFTSMDVNSLPEASKWILMILMVVGGSLCSTAGAIKVARMIVLFKLASHEVHKTMLPPKSIKPLKVGGRIMNVEDALRVASFFFIYLAVAFVSTLIITAQGIPFTSALSATLSAEGGVGPAYLDLFSLNATSKLALVWCMWVGRLELLPILALFTSELWERL